MIKLEIPGLKILEIHHILCDMNGTLAVDGILSPGVEERLIQLSEKVDIEILTADTHGTAVELEKRLPIRVTRLRIEDFPGARGEDEAKQIAVEKLGKEKTAFLGNGANDRLALKVAALSILVFSAEGIYSGAIGNADLIVPDSCAALDLFLKPKRLIASLRR